MTHHASFDAVIEKSPNKGGWTYVVWEQSAAFFGTRGLVKVRATVEGVPFESAFMAIGGGGHKLPLKGDLLTRLGKQPGDRVTIRLAERLNYPRPRGTGHVPHGRGRQA